MLSNIPAILKKKNISVSSLSKMTGLSRTTLTTLSKSEVLPDSTRIETLNKVASALNINIKSLLEFNSLSADKAVSIISFQESRKNDQAEFYELSELPVPADTIYYNGLTAIKIKTFKKLLYIAYTANENIQLEILNSRDFLLLRLLDSYYPDYPKSLFDFDNSLNSNSTLLQSMSLQDLQKLGSEIKELPLFSELQKKVVKNLKKNDKHASPSVYINFQSNILVDTYHTQTTWFNDRNVLTISLIQDLLKAKKSGKHLKEAIDFLEFNKEF